MLTEEWVTMIEERTVSELKEALVATAQCLPNPECPQLWYNPTGDLWCASPTISELPIGEGKDPFEALVDLVEKTEEESHAE